VLSTQTTARLKGRKKRKRGRKKKRRWRGQEKYLGAAASLQSISEEAAPVGILSDEADFPVPEKRKKKKKRKGKKGGEEGSPPTYSLLSLRICVAQYDAELQRRSCPKVKKRGKGGNRTADRGSSRLCDSPVIEGKLPFAPMA